MKKYMKFIILMLALIFCDVFLITHRSDIKSLETDHNLGYFEYERNRSGYTVTEGKITKILEPSSEHSIIEDPAKLWKDTLSWCCYVEFETSDGRVLTDEIFPADYYNDRVGDTVGIAYYHDPEISRIIRATRTEYVSDSSKAMRGNLIRIIAVSVLILAVPAGILMKSRNEYCWCRCLGG